MSGKKLVLLAYLLVLVVNGSVYAASGVEVNGDLSVSGQVSAPITRYVPITPGNLIHTLSILPGDIANGVIYPGGAAANTGVINFPLPADYIPGTPFNLDLFLVPLTTGGNIDFFVRWSGLNTGNMSGTGPSYESTPVPVGTISHIHKQSFTLGVFMAPLPEFVSLAIARPGLSDTNTGEVSLTGLRLSYQASR